MQALSLHPIAGFGSRRASSRRYPWPMSKKAKTKAAAGPEKRPPQISPIIAENVNTLLEYARERGDTKRALPAELSDYIAGAKLGDTISTTHLYRLLRGRSSVGADVVDLIARAYGFEAWELLVPGFDPRRRPVIIAGSELEAWIDWKIATRKAASLKIHDEGAAVHAGEEEMQRGVRRGVQRSAPTGEDRHRAGAAESKSHARRRRPTAKA